jgi:hypothetical protein
MNDQGDGATNVDAPCVTTGLFGDPNWFVDVRVNIRETIARSRVPSASNSSFNRANDTGGGGAGTGDAVLCFGEARGRVQARHVEALRTVEANRQEAQQRQEGSHEKVLT